MGTPGPRTEETCVSDNSSRGGKYPLETAKVLVPLLISGGGVHQERGVGGTKALFWDRRWSSSVVLIISGQDSP